MGDFFSKIFIRIFEKRYFNETFQAQFPHVLQVIERHRSDVLKAIEYCKKSEMAAYDFFSFEFRRLTPEEQKAVSGKTHCQWIELELERRHYLVVADKLAEQWRFGENE